MYNVYDVVHSSEHKENVVDHLKYEAKFDKKMRLAMYIEWWQNYATEEEKNSKDTTDYDEIIDVLVEQSSPYDVGEKYNVDWTGLAESYGLEWGITCQS